MQPPLTNRPRKKELRKEPRNLDVCKRRLRKEKGRFHFVRGSKKSSKKWRDSYSDLSCCRCHDWCCYWGHYKLFEGHRQSDVGSKVASALPGLIGSIVSFLFKTAGQAIGFLAKHTWLLILAAVAFLVERYIKKRR